MRSLGILLAGITCAVPALAHGTVCFAQNDQNTNVSTALTALPSGGALSTSHAYRFTPVRNIFAQAAFVFTASPNRDDFMRLEIWSDAGGTPAGLIASGQVASPQSPNAAWLGANFNGVVQLTRNTAYWFVWVEAGESIVPEEPGGATVPSVTRSGYGSWTTAGSRPAKFRIFCGDTIDTPDVRRIGFSCATSLDEQPTAWSNELPTVGNADFAIQGDHLPPSATAWLVVGFDPLFIPVFLQPTIGGPSGCALYTSSEAVFSSTSGVAPIGSPPASARPSPFGHVRYPLPIPNDPTLASTFVTVQIMALDVDASAVIPIVGSNGLQITLR